MKISTLSITMLLLSVPDAVIIFYLQAKANRMRNEKFFVTFSSLGTLLLQFLQYSGVISNTVHMFLMFVLIVIVGAVCADGGHFKALQFALMIWLSEILIESLYYVMGYLIFGKHIIVLIMDIRYAVPLKISMNVVCAVAEYGLYKLWVNKVDKMKVKLNSGILIFGTVQIAFLFITILLNYYNLTNGSVTLLLFIVDALAILFNFMLYVLVNVNLRNQQELWKKELLSAQLEKQEIRGREDIRLCKFIRRSGGSGLSLCGLFQSCIEKCAGLAVFSVCGQCLHTVDKYAFLSHGSQSFLYRMPALHNLLFNLCNSFM